MHVVGAELFAERSALVGAGSGDDAGANDVLGDLDADAAEIAAGAHDQHGLAALELGDVEEKIPRRRHVAHHHRGAMEVEILRDRNAGAGRHGDKLGKATRPLDAHHALRSVIATAVFGGDVERHDAGGGDAIADFPAADFRPDRVDDAGTVDAGNERQHRAAILLAPGAQADIEHAIDGRRMHPDADLALARHRVGQILVAQHLGRAVFVDDDRFHCWSLRRRGVQ